MDAAFEYEVLHLGFWHSGSRYSMDAAFESEVLQLVFNRELTRHHLWQFYLDLDLQVCLPCVRACLLFHQCVLECACIVNSFHQPGQDRVLRDLAADAGEGWVLLYSTIADIESELKQYLKQSRMPTHLDEICCLGWSLAAMPLIANLQVCTSNLHKLDFFVLACSQYR